jgi:S1-C subfamily serine protease
MLVTVVEPGGAGRENGIRVNDVITEVNRKTVAGQEDFDRILSGLKSGEDVVIKIMRKSPGIGPRSLVPVIVSFSLP